MPAESFLTALIRTLRASIQADIPTLFPLACDPEDLLEIVDDLEQAFWYIQNAQNEVQLLAALPGLATALQRFSDLDSFRPDDLFVRLVQWRSPRLAALLALLGVTTFDFSSPEPATARPRAHVRWQQLQALLTRPETLAHPLAFDDSDDSQLSRGLLAASLLAALITAPHRLLALNDPLKSFKIRPLPAPEPRAADDTLWSQFRAATQNWISITIPLAFFDPASPYDTAPGLTPDGSVTCAFHGYQSGGKDFLELWAGLALGGREIAAIDQGPWELRFRTPKSDLSVLGLRWDLSSGLNPFWPNDTSEGVAPPSSASLWSITLQRAGEEGQPFLVVGSPAAPHLLLQGLAFEIEYRHEPARLALAARLDDLTLVAGGQWLRTFGEGLTGAEDGLSLQCDLRLALVIDPENDRWGLQPSIGEAGFDAALGLHTLYTVNRTLGGEGLSVTLRTMRLRLRLAASSDDALPSVKAEVLLTAAGRLGPVHITIEEVGSWLGFDPQGTGLGRYVGAIPPRGMSLVLDAPPVTGGGFLRYERTDSGIERYLGALQVQIADISVTAYGIYERRPSYRSFVVVLGARFPGIQIGFGFALTGVGGVVGVHRRADTDALRLRLSSGAAGSVLFSDNPVQDAPALLDDLDAICPSAQGLFVVGPTLQLGWLAFMRFDLAILVELPGPSKVIVLGSMRAEIAAPVLQIRLDVLGTIDFTRQVVEVDARLVNSKVLELFELTGEAAFRLSWGPRPYMMLAIGGFHPAFQPEPVAFPNLARVAASLDKKVGGVKVWFRQELYLAITSNTFQIGSRTEAGVKLGSLKAEGFLAFDALIQFKPFFFDIRIAAGFKITWRSYKLASLQVSGNLSGPPLTLRARFSFEILWFDISFNETLKLGSQEREEIQPIPSLLAVLAGELEKPDNLGAAGGDDRLVWIEPGQVAGRVLVSPLGQLAWSQRRAPLNLTIERFEGVDLAHPQAVVLEAGSAPATEEWFSPNTYRKLTESEALNQSAFVRLQSGAVLNFGEQCKSDFLEHPIVRSITRITPNGDSEEAGDLAQATMPGAVQDGLFGRDAPSMIYSAAPAIQVTDEPYAVYDASGGLLAQGITEADAHQMASALAGIALPQADSPVDLHL